MATFFRRFYNDSLAQASYLLGCTRTGEALVIDPERAVDQYLTAAAAERLRITQVTETHIHADFVSGSRELAARTGARLFLSDAGPREWKYGFPAETRVEPVRGGSAIQVGDVRVDALHTPGHTPEHLTFVVTERGRDTPMGAFTGDFVFVGDVGRPDLLERAAGVTGTMRDSARQLFASLQEFQRLPDHLQIWPGHGAGSACGKALGAVPQSTLGYERLASWAFNQRDESAFVDAVLSGQPEPPPYFAVMKRVNREGPALLDSLTQPGAVGAKAVETAVQAGDTVIDVRPSASYAQSHLRGTVNAPLGKSFATYAGSIAKYDRPVWIVLNDASDPAAAATIPQLRAIGLDDVRGYVAWESVAAAKTKSGLSSIEQIAPSELRARLRRDSIEVVDVRNGYEWDAGHIDGARHIPLAQLTQRVGELDPDKPVVVHCAAGGRSAVAASVLEARGFRAVANLAGGYAVWEAGVGD